MRTIAMLALFVTTAASAITSYPTDTTEASATTSGKTAPSAATSYTMDAAQSTLGFTAMQSGADFDGSFATFRASIVFSDADLAGSRFDVEVDTKSVDTQDDDRNTALRGEDLFAVEKYPHAHFVTSSFTRKKAGQYEAVGQLTVRDVTREIHLPFTFKTVREAGKPVAWLKGAVPLKRLEFGVGQGDWQDTSVVADEVTVKFALRLVPAATPSVKKPTTPPASTTN